MSKSGAPAPKKINLAKRTFAPSSRIRTSDHVYVIKRKLGAGGFGDVYEVVCEETGKTLAAKVEWSKEGEDSRLKVSPLSSTHLLACLQREFDIYRDIKELILKQQGIEGTEHLMPVCDFGGIPRLFTVLFLPLCGPSLKDILARQQPT